MLKVQLKKSDPLTQKADLLAVFVSDTKWEKSAFAKKIDQALGGVLMPLLKKRSFEAKAGQKVSVVPTQNLPFAELQIVGVSKECAKKPIEMLSSVGEFVRALTNIKGIKTVNIVLPQLKEDDLPAERILYLSALGAHLGAYVFHKKQQDPPKPELKSVNFFFTEDSPQPKAKAVLDRAEAVADGVNFARDLVNEPPAVCTPRFLADKAKALAKEFGLKVEIWDEKKIISENMHLYYAVAKGSSEPPRFIKLEYTPSKPKGKPIVIVGKGLTFDAGGLGIKPWDGMLTMKMDMAGAAAVLGTMRTIAQLKPNRKVIALVAACENMPGAAAYKPGDIITGRAGISVEIHHTDAEGRLTLADALAFGAEQKPEFMIDLATLTGACIVALGELTAGVMGNRTELVEKVLSAAQNTGEDVWQLPLNQRLKKKLKTPVADLKNIGDRWGGAITAGLFLEAFVKDTPWVHIDIAGPAFAEKEYGPFRNGGTGFGVMTLAELIAEPKF